MNAASTTNPSPFQTKRKSRIPLWKFTSITPANPRILALVAGGYATGGTLEVHSLTAVAVLGYLTLLSSVAFALWSALLKVNRVSMISY